MCTPDLRALSAAIVIVSCSAPRTRVQEAPSTPKPDATVDIRKGAISAHIRFLADDLLEGRGTGERGHVVAAAYVASQLHAWGIEPAGDHGTFLQDVPM